MREKKPYFVVTYFTTAEAMATEKACKEENIIGKLISAPRSITSDCGISYAASPSDEARIKEILDRRKIEYEKIVKIIDDKERIQWFAAKFSNAHDVFFVGRGVDYAVSLEGSLKLKEISYIHSEAYAGGEPKHGTIALIEEGTLVVSPITQDDLCGKMESNVKEVKSRGATILIITPEKFNNVDFTCDERFVIPDCDSLMAPILGVLPCQLFAYYMAVNRGCDIDKPRNLAKSVTLE